MPITYEQLENKVNEFNIKYSVTFNLGDFFNSVIDEGDKNALYANTVIGFIEHLIANNNFTNFEIGEMCQDFESEVMEDLRTYSQEQGLYVGLMPQSFAGKAKNAFLKDIDTHLERKEWRNVDEIISKKYLLS